MTNTGTVAVSLCVRNFCTKIQFLYGFRVKKSR